MERLSRRSQLAWSIQELETEMEWLEKGQRVFPLQVVAIIVMVITNLMGLDILWFGAAIVWSILFVYSIYTSLKARRIRKQREAQERRWEEV